jgi:outer membrane protein TolC
MKHRRIWGGPLIVLTLWGLFSMNTHARELPLVRIGILRDGPTVRFPETRSILQQEILDLTAAEFDVRFPPGADLQGNWEPPRIRAALDSLLADPQIAIVVTLGAIASNEAFRQGRLPKPVIAATVIDAGLQGLPRRNDASGVRNLSYIDAFKSFERDIRAFHELTAFRHLTILVDELLLAELPRLQTAPAALGRQLGVRITLQPVGADPEAALALLPQGADAVYLTPLLRFSPEAFHVLTAGLNRQRLPSFSMWGRDEVVQGVFASMAPAADFERFARRIALNIQRILLGEAAEDLPVDFAVGRQLSINMATARAINRSPGWYLRTEADLIHDAPREGGRQLTLKSAIDEALTANLDLAAADRALGAGQASVDEARSTLLPQLDLASQGVVIDEDRAEASLGLQPERVWQGTASLTQLLYSEEAWANYTIQQHLQAARIKERDARLLDVVLETAEAYLNVLRAENFARIQQDNLHLTRANLERARVRLSSGISDRSEVFRWESALATSRKTVLEAQATVRQAVLQLNRLLQRPQEEVFTAAETDLDDPLLVISDSRLLSWVDNPRHFDLLRERMVHDGLKLSPELNRLDFTIAAQQRALVAAKRAHWLPKVVLQGSVTEAFSTSGAGSESPEFQVLPGLAPLSLPDADDTDWRVALQARLPLFTSGGQSAKVRRASEEAARLRLERRAAAERVEQRIRSALFQTSVSYPNIRLSRDAAEAARQNLTLVTDAYTRGVVSIITLLDAQNNARGADQVAANAVYNFLIDLMRVQRAAGRFSLLMAPEEREAWLQEIDSLSRGPGATPQTP